MMVTQEKAQGPIEHPPNQDFNPLEEQQRKDEPIKKAPESEPLPPSDVETGRAELVVENSNVFSQGGNNYRVLGRKDTILIMFANQIGLGILSMPSILRSLGLVPGIIAFVGIGLTCWYTSYILLQFYKRYPHVVNIVEMTAIVGGRGFEVIAGIMMVTQLIFYGSSAAVTMSIAFNILSDHGTCTVTFITVAVIICYLLCLPRTMKFVSHSGIPNAVSVIAASLIVIVGIGISGPAQAPEGWHREITIVGNPSFRDVINGCLKIIYAYASNLAFVSLMAEMKDPARDFPFCVAFLEIGSIIFYVAVAVICYCLAGQYTTSPILGAATTVISKAAYGVVLPAVMATGMSLGHTGCKYLYILSLRKTGALDQATSNTVRSWATWISCVTGFWIIAFLVANVIPVFDSILSITSAATVAWLTYGFSGIFWLHANRRCLFQDWKKTSLTLVCVGLILFSLFLNAAGLWASVTELMDIFEDESSSVHGVFSCGNNA